MRVVIVPNSFKHCLSAREAGNAMARGVHAACPEAITDIIPFSDGGDGLLDALSSRIPGTLITTETQDPLGRPIRAVWFQTRRYALIEMALASGMARLKGPAEYAPLTASTFGTGLLIRDALDHGCRRIILGLGGSATVDAGSGMASALGFQLLDRQGRPVPEGGGGLGRLAHVRIDRADFRLNTVTATALTDVQNPLLGDSGAARVFAPQKGAARAEVETLERNLTQWARVVERDLNVSVAALPGAGAAGGLGAGCAAFLGATLVSGAEWVSEQTGLRKAMCHADVVLTGEGRIDRQTALGKGPAVVGRLAQSLNKPAFALAGTVAEDTPLASLGLTQCVAITPPGMPLADALKKAETNLEKTSAELMMRVRR